MAGTTSDTHAIDQANKMARTEMKVYHEARDRAHREATKGATLVQSNQTTTRPQPGRVGSQKK